MAKLLTVAVGVLVEDDKILMLKWNEGIFKGLYSFPGGKVEVGEHISLAALREFKEETGLDVEFEEYLGVVSETIHEDDKLIGHFNLHVCKVNNSDGDLVHGPEGDLEWIPLSDVDKRKDEIVPSDHAILKKMVLNKEKHYWESYMDKQDDGFLLERFG